jgi:hypothetical protein
VVANNKPGCLLGCDAVYSVQHFRPKTINIFKNLVLFSDTVNCSLARDLALL